jgi:hypothetical protein
MKVLLLVPLIFFLSACNTIGISGSFGSGKPNITGGIKVPIGPSEVTFKTPYGIIKKGYSKEKVKSILGNAHHMTSHENTDIWYYYFNDEQRLFVYFIDDKVVEVKEKQGVKI